MAKMAGKSIVSVPYQSNYSRMCGEVYWMLDEDLEKHAKLLVQMVRDQGEAAAFAHVEQKQGLMYALGAWNHRRLTAEYEEWKKTPEGRKACEGLRKED
jgi:hypothetical protein